MKRILGLTLPLFVLALLVGCLESPDARKANSKAQKEGTEAVDAAAKALKVQRDEYRKTIENDLDSLEATLKTYRDKASKAKDEAKVAMQKQIDSLEVQRDKIRDKLKDVGSDSKDAWEEFKKGVDKAVTELKTAVEKAKDSFK